jgi:hypothetical protein
MNRVRSLRCCIGSREDSQVSYIEQVKTEFEAIAATRADDGKATIQIYDPAAFNYRPVGDEKVVGCLDGVQRLEVRNAGRYFRGGGFWDAVARGFLDSARLTWSWALRCDSQRKNNASPQPAS